MVFTGTVKKIGKKDEEKKYSVIFQRQAAFYYVNEKNVAAVDALFRSAKEKLQVEVVNDPTTMEILEANIK